MTPLDTYVLVFLPMMFFLMLAVPVMLALAASRRGKRKAVHAVGQLSFVWHAKARSSVQ